MHISQIIVYPVKSLGGTHLQSAELKASGLNHDRHWMLVDNQHQFMTQRNHPQMALIKTAIKDNRLVLSCFGMEDHEVKPGGHPDMPRISTQLWGDQLNALVHHQHTNDWVSQALGVDCQLISFADDQFRRCNPAYSKPGDHTKFADRFPLLLTSRASLNALNERLEAPVPMNRFRPNLVIEGCNAHDEDQWKAVKINNATIRMGVSCARCQVPTIDQQTGVLSGPEPIRTLATYRKREGRIFFGVYMITENEGIIKIGDNVTPING